MRRGILVVMSPTGSNISYMSEKEAGAAPFGAAPFLCSIGSGYCPRLRILMLGSSMLRNAEKKPPLPVSSF